METTTSAPTLDRCATCSAHLFTHGPPHRCPPLWLVWEEAAGPADAQPIYADFPHRAAEVWAAQHGNRHILIALGGRITVCVRSAAGELSCWEVTGELEPVYTAIRHFPQGGGPVSVEKEEEGSALTEEQQRAGFYAELTGEQTLQLRRKMREILSESTNPDLTSTELAEEAANELRLHCDDSEATIPEEIFELANDVMEE